MFFETEITNYYKDSFEIIDFNQYLNSALIVWTLLKLLFYVVPALVLFRAHDQEQATNRNIKISKIRKISRTIVIFSILIPLLDCFVFFYIVVSLISRIDALYTKTTVSCRIYGIAAGILNVILISNFQNLLMFTSGIIFTGQSEFFLAFNFSVFCAWALLSVNHLFYLYSLNEEVLRKLRHPALFSDYESRSPFTADHL